MTSLGTCTLKLPPISVFFLTFVCILLFLSGADADDVAVQPGIEQGITSYSGAAGPQSLVGETSGTHKTAEIGSDVVSSSETTALIGAGEISVDRPAAGETLTISAEKNAGYILNFDPAAAQARGQGDDLVFLFEDGGKIVFEGMAELAQGSDAPSLLLNGQDVLALLFGQQTIAGTTINKPAPGETVEYLFQNGENLNLNFDPASARVQLKGDNFVLVFGDGARIVFLQLVGLDVAQAPVFELAGLSLPSTVLVGQAVAQLEGNAGGGLPGFEGIALAASEHSAGGGELFVILDVLSYLLERLDPVSKSHAAGQEGNADSVDSPLLNQLWTQFRIARESEILEAAKNYRTNMAAILGGLKGRLEGGGGSRADVAQAEAVHLEAQVEVRDVEFRLILAVDEHQDTFGERLEESVYPDWKTPLPENYADMISGIASDDKTAALRYWRQKEYAAETTDLLEELLKFAIEVKHAYYEQFEVGQRTTLDVLGSERVFFQTRVRLAQRRFDQIIAEAWLLNAEGKLSADYIRRPGQP